MSALTNKRHEEFAQGIANGLSPVAAYRAAFPNSLNWQEASVETRANETLNDPKVKDRIDELNDASNPSILSRHDRMVLLTHIALNEEQPIRQRMNAIDLLNKMDGDYIKKVEATITQDFASTASDIEAILDEDDE